MPFGCHVAVDAREPKYLLGKAVVLDMDGHKAFAHATVRLDDPNAERTLSQLLLTELQNNGAEIILKRLGIRSYGFEVK